MPMIIQHHHYLHFDDAVLRRIERSIDLNFEILMERLNTMAQDLKEYIANQRDYNNKMGEAINEIADDVKRQGELITQIQNSPGRLSAEDQTALDELEASSKDLVARLKVVNELNPPPVPAGEGTGDNGGGQTGGETGVEQPGTVGKV